jgi:hypothetical protein
MTNLDFLEESYLTVAVKNKVYKFRVTQYHNTKVKNKKF